jgi:hypothetical protein
MSMDDYHIKQAHSAIDSLAAELAQAKKDLEEQKALMCGKLMKVVDYPMGQAMASVSGYGSPAKARRDIEALYQKCLALKDSNQAAIKNNESVYNGLRKLIAAIGIPSNYNKTVNRRSFKTESIPYDWTNGLRQLVPTHDGWPEVQRIYDRKMEEVAKWEQQIAGQKEEEERAREAEAKNIEKIKTVGILENKYGMRLSANENTLLDVILSKDKYLALAHCLLKNRRDWNDGPDYAREGLRLFAVESDLDEEICKEIQSLIDDWQGDGRVFRDCKYCYDALFNLADGDILADYQKLKEYMEQT